MVGSPFLNFAPLTFLIDYGVLPLSKWSIEDLDGINP